MSCKSWVPHQVRLDYGVGAALSMPVQKHGPQATAHYTSVCLPLRYCRLLDSLQDSLFWPSQTHCRLQGGVRLPATAAGRTRAPGPRHAAAPLHGHRAQPQDRGGHVHG